MAGYSPPPTLGDGTTTVLSGTTMSVKNGGIGKLQLATVEQAESHFAAGPTTPTRVLGTIYQNAGTTALLVLATVSITTAQFQFLVGPSSPPTTVVMENASATSINDAAFVGIVPPGWYYEIVKASGTSGALTFWQEAQL